METPAIYAVDALSEAEVLRQAQQLNVSEATPAEAIALDRSLASDSTEQTPPEVTEPAEIGLTSEQLQQAIATAVQQALSEHQQQISQLRQQLSESQQQLTESQQRNDSLQQVFRVLNVPNVNTHLATGRDRSPGLATDFIQACESAPVAVWVNKRTGQKVMQRDLNAARQIFLSQHGQLRRDMEQHAKQHGLLLGGRYLAQDAATVKTDISPALLDYLSMTIRETRRGRYVYWQFPYYELELGKGPGDVIQVGRLRWIAEPAAVSDRTLTPGTNLSGNRQNVSIGSVSLTLGERGLGSGNPGTSLPVSIPEFLTAYSIINLENAVMKVLGHDYEAYEDLSIRNRYFATTRVLYNDRGNVTATPGNVGANDDGTMTENWLNMVYAYMAGQQIPTLDDGCYVVVLHDTALGQFKNSLGERYRYPDAMAIEELSNLLQPMTNREQGKTKGYAGRYCGFHLFGTNAHSMGLAGTEGVANEALGVGNTLTRASLAFGQMAVARAIGMEAEIRRNNNDDFGRANDFTWLSHETTGDLDVDPAIAAEQQLGVVELHTTDVVL